MFYMTRRVKGLIGVIDTEDGVEDFFSVPDIEGMRKQGVCIINRQEMKEVVHFVWHFMLDRADIGPFFPAALDFILGKRKDLPVHGSRESYAYELKRDYEEVKEYGFDISLYSLPTSSDMLVSRLVKLYSLKGEAREVLIQELITKWHLDEDNLRHWYDED